MLRSLMLKVTKFQLPPPKRLSTVVKNILGGHHGPHPMSNRVKGVKFEWAVCSQLNKFERHKEKFGNECQLNFQQKNPTVEQL